MDDHARTRRQRKLEQLRATHAHTPWVVAGVSRSLTSACGRSPSPSPDVRRSTTSPAAALSLLVLLFFTLILGFLCGDPSSAGVWSDDDDDDDDEPDDAGGATWNLFGCNTAMRLQWPA
jgi:hypothetical protein